MEEIVIEEISSSLEAEEESKRSRDIIEMSQNKAPVGQREATQS